MNIRIAAFYFLFSGVAVASDGQEYEEILRIHQGVISRIDSQLTEMKKELEEQKALVSDLQQKIIPGLSEKVSFNRETNTVVFSGVNVMVVNGEGRTDTVNGLGNLIVGYDESSQESVEFCSDGAHRDKDSCEQNGSRWGKETKKSGSHNIVGGVYNSYTSFGGIVVGGKNAITRGLSTVTGGHFNLASGEGSSVTGGAQNTASGVVGSVTGGAKNQASGRWSTVSGGKNRTSPGDANWRGGRYLGFN